MLFKCHTIDGTWPSCLQIWNADLGNDSWAINSHEPSSIMMNQHLRSSSNQQSDTLYDAYRKAKLNLISFRYLPQPDKMGSKRTNSSNQIRILWIQHHRILTNTRPTWCWNAQRPYDETAALCWCVCVSMLARANPHISAHPPSCHYNTSNSQ